MQTHHIQNPALGTQDHSTAYLDVAAQRASTEPPLVFVHGYTGSTLDFRDQLTSFAQRRRVLALDQRGHGNSSHQTDYSLPQLALDLLAWMDAMEIAQCDLLGHSMGGIVALRAAVGQPDRFRSLILMDTSAQPIEIMTDSMASQLAKIVGNGGCEALLPMMQGAPPTPEMQRSIETLGEAEYWQRIRTKLTQMDPLAFTQLGPAMGQHALSTEQLVSISCPTTVLVGALDKPFLAPSRHLRDHLPDARLELVPNAAHSPQFENPQFWQQTIADHLANLR